MRVPRTIGWGIALALATAVISGFSVYLNGQFIKRFDDPTLLAASATDSSDWRSWRSPSEPGRFRRSVG
jgi:hypothetical protein